MTDPARCQVCAQPLVERVVTCAKCETPHHAGCFEFAGQCSTYACGSRDARELSVQPAAEEPISPHLAPPIDTAVLRAAPPRLAMFPMFTASSR